MVSHTQIPLLKMHLHDIYSSCLNEKNLKPMFYCKLGLHWLPNVNEISTNVMKCTWPMLKFCFGDPKESIYWLALGFCVGGNANFMFRVGIANTNFHILGADLILIPNDSSFASQWYIGFM